jgi:homoserine kinase
VHSAGGCGSSAATIAAIVAIMNTAARYLYLEITAKPRSPFPSSVNWHNWLLIVL